MAPILPDLQTSDEKELTPVGCHVQKSGVSVNHTWLAFLNNSKSLWGLRRTSDNNASLFPFPVIIFLKIINYWQWTLISGEIHKSIHARNTDQKIYKLKHFSRSVFHYNIPAFMSLI